MKNQKDYRCTNCDLIFSTREEKPRCTRCGKEKTHRVFSSCNFILKGRGFYSNGG